MHSWGLLTPVTLQIPGLPVAVRMCTKCGCTELLYVPTVGTSEFVEVPGSTDPDADCSKPQPLDASAAGYIQPATT